ncbi:hypothetical protein ASZ78_004929 [Callipepla squamata]|uniref:Uncharacterized protein n=1 Tax=Callipepla squamata TaxID=9009 RepID=A0A226MM57_CALSU|nr:hypothetical protein ASZ78_004929 [Callipepla squamata]
MYLKRPAGGLAFCLFYLASCFTNKYVLSVLKFTYPTLFQGDLDQQYINYVFSAKCKENQFYSEEVVVFIEIVLKYGSHGACKYAAVCRGNCGVKPTYCGGLLAIQRREVVNVWHFLISRDRNAKRIQKLKTPEDSKPYLYYLVLAQISKTPENVSVCTSGYAFEGMRFKCAGLWLVTNEVITASLSPFFFAMTANVLTISCHARQDAQYILSYACDEDLKADGSELVQHRFGLYREAKCTVL